MATWKINCMEDEYPGLWHTWFREQMAAVGWPPDEYKLRTNTDVRAWSDAHGCLLQIAPGDKIVVELKPAAPSRSRLPLLKSSTGVRHAS